MAEFKVRKENVSGREILVPQNEFGEDFSTLGFLEQQMTITTNDGSEGNERTYADINYDRENGQGTIKMLKQAIDNAGQPRGVWEPINAEYGFTAVHSESGSVGDPNIWNTVEGEVKSHKHARSVWFPVVKTNAVSQDIAYQTVGEVNTNRVWERLDGSVQSEGSTVGNLPAGFDMVYYVRVDDPEANILTVSEV